jgi:hypothetical protein
VLWEQVLVFQIMAFSISNTNYELIVNGNTPTNGITLNENNNSNCQQ